MKQRRFAYTALTFGLSLGMFLAFLQVLGSRQALTELFVCTAELDIQLRSHGFRSERFDAWADELKRRHRNLDVAQRDDRESIGSMLRRADQALYQAKKSSRNRVEKCGRAG